MKNILNKIEFHSTYLFIALGFSLTGYFYNLIIFTSLILVHEFGHYLMCIKYNVQVKKLIIYPYGGLIKTDDLINRNIDEELLIAIMGIFFQTMYYTIILILYKCNYIRDYIFNIYTMYHYSMLIFNILPVYPLDGFKIFNLILSKIFSFNLSNYISLFISFFMIIIIFMKGINNYSYMLIIFVLIENTYKYYKELKFLYNKFILERYLYKYNYNKIKIIKNKKEMYKNKMHIFKIEDKYIKEKDYLKNIYENIYEKTKGILDKNLKK